MRRVPWRICLLGVVAAVVAGSARADTWYPTTGFGVEGIARVGAVDAIATAPDGTIITAGSGDRTVWLYRYSADGRSIGFGSRGKPRSLATGADCTTGLVVGSDGTILLACGDIVAALRSNGSLRSLTSISGAHFDSLAIDPLGRTVAAGDILLRLRPDGRIDPSFARTTLPSPAVSVVVDGGRVLVVGGGLIRGYLDDGSFDPSFGNGGVASFPGFIASSIATYSHWILAGGSRGAQAAVVRYLAGGSVDTAFGSAGIVTWGPDTHVSEAVVALGVRRDGTVDTAVSIVDAFYAYFGESPEDWFVQRVAAAGELGDSAAGPIDYIDPTEGCLSQVPLALAELPNGRTLVSSIACPDAIDYSPTYLLEAFNQRLQPDLGVPLEPHIGAAQFHDKAVTARIAINGPCRLLVRIQAWNGRVSGPWLSATRLDVAHGPVLVRLPLTRGELRPRGRYAVHVSAYDARGRFTVAIAPLPRRP